MIKQDNIWRRTAGRVFMVIINIMLVKGKLRK